MSEELKLSTTLTDLIRSTIQSLGAEIESRIREDLHKTYSNLSIRSVSYSYHSFNNNSSSDSSKSDTVTAALLSPQSNNSTNSSNHTANRENVVANTNTNNISNISYRKRPFAKRKRKGNSNRKAQANSYEETLYYGSKDYKGVKQLNSKTVVESTYGGSDLPYLERVTIRSLNQDWSKRAIQALLTFDSPPRNKNKIRLHRNLVYTEN